MTVIYQPKGAAREYAPLACNLYRGCAHGCDYCYAPACLRQKPEQFHADPTPRPGVLGNIARELPKLDMNAGPVLLCFTSDPYQPIEAEAGITRDALRLFGEAGVPVRVLTKAGDQVRRDFDLMKQYDVELGITLHLSNEGSRQLHEPRAAPVHERAMMLAAAHEQGIRTWCSVEPVIYPEQALWVINDMLGCVDTWKIGKLNHDAAREKAVDWNAFLRRVLERMDGRRYYIKHDLWKFADDAIRARWPKTNIEGLT